MNLPERKTRTALSVACLMTVGAILVVMEYPERGFAFKGENQASSEDRTHEVARLVELTQAVGMLREHYAFQARLRPRHMLFAALQGVEDALEYVLVSPAVDLDDSPLGDKKPLPQRFTVQVRGKTHSFSAAKVDDLYQMTWKLLEVFNQFHEDEETQRKMEDAAIEGMVSVLDPHTVYLDEAAFKEMKMSTRGSFGGLGIVISVRDGNLRVISVFPRTPASRGGLKKKDHIVRIGDESTINMLVSDAAKRMRGKPGSEVAIWVKRKGWDKPREFLLTRETIKVDSVLPRDLDGEIAYVHVKGFQQSTAKEVQAFLDETYPNEPPKGLILDLRGNSGGVMSSAVSLADLFLAQGNIVTTVEKASSAMETDRSANGDRYEKTAIVVLVDHGSASASEIVTAALKFRQRGLVMGTRTFGKGSIQYVNGLDRGALKLTVGQYVGPGMETIQGQGIDPHVQLLSIHYGKDIYLPSYATEFEGEAALPFHLDDTGALRIYDPPGFSLRYLPIDEKEEEDEFEYDAIRIDTPVHLAWAILANYPSPDPAVMLEQAMDYLESMRQFEALELADLASEWGKRWEPGMVSPEPGLSLDCAVTPSKLSAGEKGQIEVTVANNGTAPAPRLFARSGSSNYKLDGKTCLLGHVEPGGTASCVMHFKVHQSSPAREDRVFVDLLSGDEDLISSTSTTARVLPSGKPRLRMSYFVDDTRGNGDHAIQVGEQFEVVLHIANTGDRALKKGLATLKNLSGAALFLSRGRIELEGLKPGEEKTVRFDVRAQKQPEGDRWKFQLAVIDMKARSSFSATQDLPATSAGSDVKAEQSWPSPEEPFVFVQPAVKASTLPEHGRMGDADSLALTGTVDYGDRLPPSEAGVSVYLNGRKVALAYFGDIKENQQAVPFSLPITLEEGVNRIVVTAYQKNQSPAYMSLYYNRQSPANGRKE